MPQPLPSPIPERAWQARTFLAVPYQAREARRFLASLLGNAVPYQAREARRFLASLLGNSPFAADALTCLSELVSNAILHSNSRLPGGAFTVRVHTLPGRVRVEVHDNGGPWTPLHPGLPATGPAASGRGLLIVATLATQWGITPTAPAPAPARTAWFLLGPPPASAAAPAHTLAPVHRARRWTTLADGARLRAMRHQQQLTQQELAARAGVSPRTVARLESQPQPTCRGRTLARLAAALGTHPAAAQPTRP